MASLRPAGVLEWIDSRGGTAFYDALHLALAHLTEKASWDKKVLLLQVVANAIADDIRNQYVLAYTPTNGVLDGKFRKVEVKLWPPRKYEDLTVRSRGGYYAESKPRSTEQPEQPSGL